MSEPGVCAAAAAYRARRKERGLTQQDIHAATGLAVSSLIAFEKGRSWPRQRTQADLEEVVGWPAGKLESLRRAPVSGEVAQWTAPVLAGLRQVEAIAIQAVRASRGAPAVIEQLERVHALYEELTARTAPGSE